jgi:hypothetical protein
LLTSLARVIDVPHKETVILPEFRRLSSDPSFRVRQQCAENLGSFSQTLGFDLSRNELVGIEWKREGIELACEYPKNTIQIHHHHSFIHVVD